MESWLRVFVYGTLKPGGRYHQRCCGDFLSEATPALVKGRLYDFPQLGYPAMTPGEDWVKGFVLTFRQSAAVCADVLRRLDRLENYSEARSPKENDYQRCQRSVFYLNREPWITAWIYEMTIEQVHSYGGVYLPSGEWSRTS